MSRGFLSSKRVCMTLVAMATVLSVYFLKDRMGVSDDLVEHTMSVLVGISGWYLANRTATHTVMFGGTKPESTKTEDTK